MGTSFSEPYSNDHDGYLRGQLLVATPLISGSCFHRSVIYLFGHSEDGAMGVIINQPLSMVKFGELLDQVEIPHGSITRDIPVHFGGPVDRARGFVVHTDDYFGGEVLARSQGLAVSANTEILRDIAVGNGPRKAILAVGYAGWSAGQLESEIEANSWITVPATEQLIFTVPEDMKWGLASQSLGIDMSRLSSTVGHA